ncbi:glycoside hydrolase family 25 protein [Nordella sp. HKS 07]|uniref:glycoside hydrolase family 25 protein n=1 Tax=Nordella sp. HKS 07 TaxID=2712222 RepID=UPI0013E11FAE|nr:GH25 family lysozyme [Nordella sp. HKS 07]QIG49125.1 glycoside hydrolase family 25 protein [Nordella sp. HKS 07]
MPLDRRRMAVFVVALGMFAAGLGAGAAFSGPLSDKKPNKGVAVAHTMPVQGIDVSYYQGDINWQKVSDAGVHFAYIKATEGADRFDPKFLANWRAAKKAGVARGAYHFMYWCSKASQQASWFKSHVPEDDDALPPVLDVEWNSHSKTCPRRIARADAIAKIKVMLAAMEAHTGKRPIIYTDPKFHREVLEGEFTDYHFWLRSVAAKPETKYPGRNWAFWQFTTTGRVQGVAGPVDRNSFNGTPADWKVVLEKRCICGTAASMSSNE